MNCKQYSFYNVISGRHSEEEQGWIDTPQAERLEALEAFKSFLLGYTREGSKPNAAIRRMSLSNLPKQASIWQRLVIEPSGKAGYIAGQDYTSEIRTLKELIVKGCY